MFLNDYPQVLATQRALHLNQERTALPPLEEDTKLPLQLHQTVPTVHISPVNEQLKPQVRCESWSRYTF